VDELLLLPAAAWPAPWIGMLLGDLRLALLLLPVVVLLACGAHQALGPRRTALFLAGAALIFAADGARSWPQFGLQLAVNGLTVGMAAFVVGWLFRGNDLAYVLMFLLGRALAAGVQWIEQPSEAIRAQGLLFVGSLLAVAVLALLAAARPGPPAARAGDAPSSAWGLAPHSSAARSSAADGKM
jgi:hypothetical protein